jgi:hypothetical protein
MARNLNLKGFAAPNVLGKIETGHLLELLAPHRGYFEARGFNLPESSAEPFNYRQLSLVLLASDEETPPELVEALHVIGNVGTAARMDDLLQIALQNGVDAGGDDLTPIDLAVRLWLRVPKALEKLERDERFEKKLKFEHFPARKDAPLIAAEDLPTHVAPIEADIELWLQDHQRGLGCNIDRVISGAEIRFLIDHGLPWKRERCRQGRESSRLQYRPEASDLVICDTAANELRVHTSTIGEMRLYVDSFGRHLFGDEHHFTFDSKYTLDPLKQRGREALFCQGVAGLERIKLRELQWDWNDAVPEVEIHRGADLFPALELHRKSIPHNAVLLKAIFEVHLTGIEKPRIVWIRPPSTAGYGRGEEAALIELWFRYQGFILLGAMVSDEKTDTIVAGA